ncbi:hypothetical protein HCU40_22775 (plasmid) [Pseudanabaena biceps]|nr:hypothetical protein [Pseudanabaena biceps]
MYGVEVSPTLISNVTDAVIDEVKQWQNRPLDAVYPIVFLDCLVIKVRDNGRVINKSLYFALAVNMDGYKELLGMWISRLGRCEILVISTHRNSQPWGQRHFDCLCRWLDWFSQCH